MPSTCIPTGFQLMPLSMGAEDINKIQSFLRKRFTNFEYCCSLIGCERQKRNLLDMLQRTVNIGESNSVIIIGRAGSGKTALLNLVLENMKSNALVSSNFLQINLNGWLQTDDRIAIKEITVQLQLENCVGDRIFGSFSENLAFLLDALKKGNHRTKAVFFILDEFDLFCSHHNQALLYNLFDVAQSAKTPVAVVGLTQRLDVMELFEKRVKSRFSHRQIHMLTNFTFEQYLGLFEQLLSLPPYVCDILTVATWNQNIKDMAANSAVRGLLHMMFNLSKDINCLKSYLLFCVCNLNSIHQNLDAELITSAYVTFSQDSKLFMLQGVSMLELCLILAMKRLNEVYDGEPFNFEMTYKEYLKFAANCSSLLFDKAIVLKAFEHLIAVEFIQPAEGCNSRIQKGYRLMNFLLEPSQVIDAMQKLHGIPTEIKQWSTSVVI